MGYAPDIGRNTIQTFTHAVFLLANSFSFHPRNIRNCHRYLFHETIQDKVCRKLNDLSSERCPKASSMCGIPYKQVIFVFYIQFLPTQYGKVGVRFNLSEIPVIIWLCLHQNQTSQIANIFIFVFNTRRFGREIKNYQTARKAQRKWWRIRRWSFFWFVFNVKIWIVMRLIANHPVRRKIYVNND